MYISYTHKSKIVYNYYLQICLHIKCVTHFAEFFFFSSIYIIIFFFFSYLLCTSWMLKRQSKVYIIESIEIYCTRSDVDAYM